MEVIVADGRTARYKAEDRMRSEIENAEADNTQRRYARFAGFLFLGEIILAFGSGFVLSHIAGSGTFAETTKKIAALERSYRAALSTVLIVTLSSVVLAFALYATLKPVTGCVQRFPSPGPH
jgi:heme/copper-type cytochrome/quinol oxidase subunit 3